MCRHPFRAVSNNFNQNITNGTLKKEMHYLNKCELTIKNDSIGNGMVNSYLITNECPDGVWKEYDENGKLVKTVIYKNCIMIKEE